MEKAKYFCEYSDLESFVKDYSKQYFRDACSSTPGVSKRNQTDRTVEMRVMKILESGIKGTEDVYDILAWKTGRIKQQKYSDDMPFEYYKGCSRAEYELKVRGNSIPNLHNYAERVLRMAPEIKTRASSGNLDKVFELLLSDAPTGIGAVYAITLLFFLTKGEQPIYDQYAMRALVDMTQYSSTYYHDLPQRGTNGEISRSYIKKLTEEYSKYKGLLEQHFGDTYQRCRDIDRALWVYGHLCKDKENKCSN